MAKSHQREKRNICNFQARTKLSYSGLNNNEKRGDSQKRKLVTMTITASAAVHIVPEIKEMSQRARYYHTVQTFKNICTWQKKFSESGCDRQKTLKLQHEY